MANQKKPIGVFDSGIGGLSFLSKATEILPNEYYIYFGDNKNAPYGNLTGQRIFELTEKAFEYFQKAKVKAAVLACNTVTAECAERLRQKYPFKIIGIEPPVKPALKCGGKTAVLCTSATANSQKFKKLIEKYGGFVVVLPDLAGLIEQNIFNLQDFDYPFEKVIPNDTENIVIGCTHYCFVTDKLKNYGRIFDGNLGTALHLKDYLEKANLINSTGGYIKFRGSGRAKNRAVFKKINSKSKKNYIY